MANYVKVNKRVAQVTGHLRDRYIYNDGNYQLWELDLAAVDPDWAFHKDAVLERIGGVMFDSYANRDEQRRPANEQTPLPEPADPYFSIDRIKEEEAVVMEIAEEIAEGIGEEIAEATEEKGGEP
ncbi:MAG: hypothetical protein K2N96_08550 [Muribaculaceae bacterium]|nr:hypothetical protein [Muribaculaceae bacterium]